MEDTAAVIFAVRLKKWRNARNMSQHELSKRCRISAPSISIIESGKAKARLSTMVDIVENGFGMTLRQFLSEDIPQTRRRRERVSGMPLPNLRQWRVLAKLTTRQLADRAGVTLNHINYLENGGSASTALAYHIAHIFGTTPEGMNDIQIVSINGDPSIDFLSGKGIEEVAAEFEEKFVKPIRQKKAEKKLDAALDDDALAKVIEEIEEYARNRPPSLNQILASLQEDVEAARAGRLEEEVEEE